MDLRDSFVLGPSARPDGWQVHRVAHERWLHQTCFHRADFDAYCIAVVLGGRGTYWADDAEWTLCAGSVFTFAPGGPHAYCSQPGASLELVISEFDGPEADELLVRCLGRTRGAVRCRDPERVFAAARLYVETTRASQPYADGACAHLVRALLHLVAGGIDDGRSEGLPPPRADLLVERARACMQRDWRELAGPAEVAARCGVSHAHLCRAFRRRLGTTPAAHLLRIRMRHAARALLEGDAPLRDLAEQHGFSDAFAFSKAFKRAMGLAPRSYRERHLAGERHADPPATR